jgi:L-asparagine oxygenase
MYHWEMGTLVTHPPVVLFDYADLRAAIAALRAGLAGGAVLISGAPVGDLPPTPTEKPTEKPGAKSGGTGKLDRTSETTLLGVAALLGEAVGYIQEHGGDVVQDLYPLAASANRQVSTSSNVQLAFHTETAFHPHKPRYLVLLCLKGDPAARTTLCSVAAVEPLLDPSTLQLLSEPRFRTGVDESFGTTSWMTPAHPVIRRSADRNVEEFTFDGDLTIGIDTEAQDALERLAEAIFAAQTAVVLRSGDVLVVDNHRAVHGRSPFPARFDGTDRWLQRTFVVTDLAASQHERVGRVIVTEFRD